MFFGGAAYVGGHILKTTGLPPEIGILAGGVAAGLLGLVIGLLTMRRQGIQFAMITLAFSQFIYSSSCRRASPAARTGCSASRATRSSASSMSAPTRPTTSRAGDHGGCVFVYYRVVNSPYGEVLKAVRDNQARVESLGFDPEKIKLVAFVISAAMAGVAGATKATVYQFATLTDASWPCLGEVILMTLLGGLGTLTGPIFGAAIIILLNDHLAGFGEFSLITQGVILLIVVVFFRRGIVGETAAFLAFLKRRRTQSAGVDVSRAP